MFQKASKVIIWLLMVVGMICVAMPVQAGVTAEEAARLKNDLTPLGAERAGNTEGTIPAWDGGLTGIPPGISYDPNKGLPLPDPFAADKVLFSITAENMAQYADKLSEGQKALLKKYPATFRLDVYPTRRSMAAPQWVYDNTYQNALNGKIEDRISATNVHGGIPFPIPKTGVEAIFNHLAHWKGPDRVEYVETKIIFKDGRITVNAVNQNSYRFPYYDQDVKREDWNGLIDYQFVNYLGPPFKKGEMYVAHAPLDYRETTKLVWQYLPGQRRVRRAPNIAFDYPYSSSTNMSFIDDVWQFNGSLERFDWKLLGKKEMYIPYNCYKLLSGKQEDYLTPGHLNPDYFRWELHRVWVVESTLRSDSRHAYGKRIMHLDEDSWINLTMDCYDTRGVLWRNFITPLWNQYDIPGIFLRAYINYDFLRDDWAILGWLMELGPDKPNTEFKKLKDSDFSAGNIRRMGHR